PRHLARAEQSLLHAAGRQQPGVTAGVLEGGSEYLVGAVRRRLPADRRGHRGGYRRCVGDRRGLEHHRAGNTTTRRLGSSPSDSLRCPASATASCTIFRSNGDMAARVFGFPVLATSSATE